MLRWFWVFLVAEIVLVLLMTVRGDAQVAIVRNGEEVPDQKVNILFDSACRVIAKEFHVRDASQFGFKVTLVLGDADERIQGDELTHVYFVYMNHWNDVKFATAASRLALQHLVSQERKTKLVSEILRRAEREAPVSARELKRSRDRSSPASGFFGESSELSPALP
jgi:hypothetical protein